MYDAFVSLAVRVALTDNAAWYCWHASRKQALLEAVWEKNGAFVHQQIIWLKDRPILTRSWYMWQHEPCFFGWRKGKKPARVAKDYPPSVWQFPTHRAGETTDHPTQKPVELFAIPLRQHTRKGEVCYEPFAGSGTQFVAAELLGRVCYAMEKSPPFVGVILERMLEMGLKPRLLKAEATRCRSVATRGAITRRPARGTGSNGRTLTGADTAGAGRPIRAGICSEPHCAERAAQT